MKTINILKKFDKVQEHWTPKIVGELNNQYIKFAKVKADFVWHSHENEDELFVVYQGTLIMDFRDKTVEVRAGEMIIVPKGVEHRPVADEEVAIMLFEPATTLNTGNLKNERTKEQLDQI